MEIALNEELNHENYWSEAFKRERELVKEYWRSHPWINVISLIWSVIKRLFVGYVILPSVFMFMLFLLESYTNGLAETLNMLFVGNSDSITESDVEALMIIYHMAALIFFFMTWFLPWKSPAFRYAQTEMDRWHRIHGDKMFPPKSE